jgi:hypothetical protein
MPEFYQYALLMGKNPSDEWQEGKVDGSGSITFISHEHSKIHQGKFYSLGYSDAALGNGSSLVILATTNSYELHTHITLACGGDASFSVHENPTITSNGSAITPVNHNRTSSKTSTTTFYNTPTLSNNGTLIWSELIVGGSGGITPGGNNAQGIEQTVLAPNTSYVFTLTNTAGTAQPSQIILSYYEV